ncbi:unnamed protein product [Fraxinus pennsylvanica]|uniref:Uncharacterized protein n=1 Tax=Fraxinus pennsylvanica TaxID=56036 RepID=A0AAD2E317_9LAMI|nr:unnamed protein product [Fraxinus pennsylvanica]
MTGIECSWVMSNDLLGFTSHTRIVTSNDPKPSNWTGGSKSTKKTKWFCPLRILTDLTARASQIRSVGRQRRSRYRCNLRTMQGPRYLRNGQPNGRDVLRLPVSVDLTMRILSREAFGQRQRVGLFGELHTRDGSLVVLELFLQTVRKPWVVAGAACMAGKSNAC